VTTTRNCARNRKRKVQKEMQKKKRRKTPTTVNMPHLSGYIISHGSVDVLVVGVVVHGGDRVEPKVDESRALPRMVHVRVAVPLLNHIFTDVSDRYASLRHRRPRLTKKARMGKGRLNEDKEGVRMNTNTSHLSYEGYTDRRGWKERKKYWEFL